MSGQMVGISENEKFIRKWHFWTLEKPFSPRRGPTMVGRGSLDANLWRFHGIRVEFIARSGVGVGGHSQTGLIFRGIF